MPGKVLARGVLHDPHEPVVTALDRGFLYGDAVFETLRVYRRAPFRFDAHLGRLRSSAERIGMTLPWSDAALRGDVGKTLEAAELDDAVLRIVVTRGAGALGLDPAGAKEPELVVMALPLPLPAKGAGPRAVIVTQRRPTQGGVDPLAKTSAYLLGVLATAEARRRGAEEAILLNERGEVAEAASANVFALIDGVWCTPPDTAGILLGITRDTLLTACRRHHVPVLECSMTPADLGRAAGIVLTSSVREVVRVTALDGASLGGVEAAAALAQLYRREVESTA
jgi:branched-chain amino acid aminotransferase